jgi:hypothetical protein
MIVLARLTRPRRHRLIPNLKVLAMLIDAAVAGVSLLVGTSLPVAAASSPAPTDLYLSPTGTATSGCSVSAPCSLLAARAVVRSLTPSMTSDIVVRLRGGTYRLGATWAFSDAAHDAGRNGHRVIYASNPGVHR